MYNVYAVLQSYMRATAGLHTYRLRSPFDTRNNKTVVRQPNAFACLSRQALRADPASRAAEDATALFGRAGRVVMVRICQPGGGPRTTAQTVSVKNLTTSNEARCERCFLFSAWSLCK